MFPFVVQLLFGMHSSYIIIVKLYETNTIQQEPFPVVLVDLYAEFYHPGLQNRNFNFCHGVSTMKIVLRIIRIRLYTKDYAQLKLYNERVSLLKTADCVLYACQTQVCKFI